MGRTACPISYDTNSRYSAGSAANISYANVPLNTTCTLLYISALKYAPDMSTNATSPTVLTEAAMLISTIDALEGRDVAVVDISGAYLSADMYNKLHVVFRGTLA